MGQVSYLSIGTLGAFFFWWETLSLHGLPLPQGRLRLHLYKITKTGYNEREQAGPAKATKGLAKSLVTFFHHRG